MQERDDGEVDDEIFSDFSSLGLNNGIIDSSDFEECQPPVESINGFPDKFVPPEDYFSPQFH